jgi:hypothetical protein
MRMLRLTTMPPSEIDDQAARRLGDRQAGTDRGRHGLLDQPRPARAGVEGCVADGALLDFGDARRDAQQHARPRDQAHPVVDLVDEVLDHLLGHVEVADHAVAQRSDGDDAGGRAAEHALRLGAYGEHAARPRLDGDHAGLADHDPAIADVDEGVGSAEVDPDVAGEQAEERVEHWAECPLSSDVWVRRARSTARP